MTPAQDDLKHHLKDDLDQTFNSLELSAPVRFRVRHWLQTGHNAVTLPSAIIEAVHHEHEPNRVHVTTLMKLLRIGAVDFCKQLNQFIDQVYAELSDAFISEAKEFVGRTIQLWVLYCKYRSIFEERWNLSDRNHNSTLFTCGWLLFLTIRSEINATWKSAPDLLYRLFALINASIARLANICPPDHQPALAEVDDEIVGTCRSLVEVIIERLMEEGVWFENDLVRSVAGLGRHLDRVVCSSDEVWQCWLFDGRVLFSDELRDMCERTLQLGLSPIIRSPSKSADTSPIGLMSASVRWLLKVVDGAAWPSDRVLQHWATFQPAKFDHLLEQHRQRSFRFGSNDPVVISHRLRLSILVFCRLLDSLVDHEAARRGENQATVDFSNWLDSTGFLHVLFYLSSQVVIGAYRTRVVSQEQLTSVFNVTPLDSIAALRNLLKTPLIDDHHVRNYLFSVYQQFVLLDAWKDRALSAAASNGHVRSLYRAAHSFAIDALQFLTRNMPQIGVISGRALEIIDHIIRHQAALLVVPLGLDAVITCTLYGLSKISDKCSIQLIPTYKLLLRHRSLTDYCNGPDLLRFYNQSFVPLMKSILFSVSESVRDHESSAISSDSSVAISCTYTS